MKSRRRQRARLGLIRALSALGLASIALPASADVIEIGDDGVVVTHRAPTLFLSEETKELPRSREEGRASAAPAPLINAANHAALSAALIEAVAWQESRLRPDVVSSAGAIGEMQLMPQTARALGVDPFDTQQNFRGGAAYLRQMLDRYDGDIELALAAYNAGPGAVDRYHGVPPFRETRAYVAAVLERLSNAAEADSH